MFFVFRDSYVLCIYVMNVPIFRMAMLHNRNDLYKLLKNLHFKIKSTIGPSFKELLLLDIFIINQNDQVITDIYDKPTETQQ